MYVPSASAPKNMFSICSSDRKRNRKYRNKETREALIKKKIKVIGYRKGEREGEREKGEREREKQK